MSRRQSGRPSHSISAEEVEALSGVIPEHWPRRACLSRGSGVAPGIAAAATVDGGSLQAATPFLLSSSPIPVQGADEAAAPNRGREIQSSNPRTKGKEDMLSFRQRLARDEGFT